MKSQPPLTVDQLIPWEEEDQLSQPEIYSGSENSQASGGNKEIYTRRCRSCQSARVQGTHSLCSVCEKRLLARNERTRKLKSDWDKGPSALDSDEDMKLELRFDTLMLSLPPESDWNCE